MRFFSCRDCIGKASLVERTGLSEGIIPEEVGIRLAGDFELGKFGKDRPDGNSSFEGKGFRIGRTVAREDGKHGGSLTGRASVLPLGTSGNGLGRETCRSRHPSGELGKFAKCVFRHRDAFGRAVPDERIGSDAPGTHDVSRNREDFFSEVEGELGRYQASRFLTRFGNERSVGKTGH